MARDMNETIYRILVSDIYDVAESYDRNVDELTDDVVERVIHKLEAMSFEDLATTIDMFIEDAIRESQESKQGGQGEDSIPDGEHPDGEGAAAS